jgi:hypothetical protein
MIAHAAWRRLARGEASDPRTVEASSRLPLGEREPEDPGTRVRGRTRAEPATAPTSAAPHDRDRAS